MSIAWAIVSLLVGLFVGVMAAGGVVKEKYARVYEDDILICVYRETAFTMTPLAETSVSSTKTLDSAER